MHNRPIGFDDDAASTDGVTPYAGGVLPGPLGIAPVASQRRARGEATDRGALAAALGALFTVRSDTYRLRRTDAEWRPRLDEVIVPPDEAAVVLEQAIVQHARNVELVTLLRIAASRLGEVERDHLFVLLRVRPQVDELARPAQAVVAATPSALRPASPAPPPEVREAPVFGDDQARVLKHAALYGVPFCEECARAAARRAASSTAEAAMPRPLG
jgi:hypothetical protein